MASISDIKTQGLEKIKYIDDRYNFKDKFGYSSEDLYHIIRYRFVGYHGQRNNEYLDLYYAARYDNGVFVNNLCLDKRDDDDRSWEIKSLIYIVLCMRQTFIDNVNSGFYKGNGVLQKETHRLVRIQDIPNIPIDLIDGGSESLKSLDKFKHVRHNDRKFLYLWLMYIIRNFLTDHRTYEGNLSNIKKGTEITSPDESITSDSSLYDEPDFLYMNCPNQVMKKYEIENEDPTYCENELFACMECNVKSARKR